jgi:hypothetical protein
MYTLCKKLISILRQDYEFSWMIESQMLVLPLATSKDSTIWIWSKKKGEIGKITTHTITQILLVFFKYMYTIKNFKIKLNTWTLGET